MKKFVSVLLMVSIAAVTLCGCGKFTCDICGQEKSSGKNEVEILGEKLTYCDDCYNSMMNIFN